VFVLSCADARALEPEALRVPLYAQNFNRYEFQLNDEWRIIFPYDLTGEQARVLELKEFKSKFPRAFAHLQSKQAALQERKQFREWYGFSAARNLKLHNRAHIA